MKLEQLKKELENEYKTRCEKQEKTIHELHEELHRKEEEIAFLKKQCKENLLINPNRIKQVCSNALGRKKDRG
jgi:hypothetical protein